MAEVTLAGLTLTQEEWDSLDEESRSLLRDVLVAQPEEPYDAYEVTIEELFPALFE